MATERTRSLRLVGATALITSLGWLALFGFWLESGQPGRVALSGPVHPAPATSEPLFAVQAAPGASQLLIPVAGVAGAQLTDSFSDDRAAGARRHEAIDIMAPRGTPVLAAAPGRVEKLFLSRDGGNTIYLRAPDGTRIYYYAHLDSYAPGLAEGANVRAGDRLGEVGSSGDASPDAPHLHFAILETTPAAKWYEPARAINPYPLLHR